MMLADRFAYEHWANRRVIEALANLGAPGEACRLMAHIVAAQRVWLTRIHGKSSDRLPVFPDHELATISELEVNCNMQVGDLLKDLRMGVEELDRQVAYKSRAGRGQKVTIEDILHQLLAHGAHHRGQIALLLRQAGHEPPKTDYLIWRWEQKRSRVSRSVEV